MSKRRQEKTLNWDEFRALGDPESEPEQMLESEDALPEDQALRVYLEKKGRRGKSVTLIRGFLDETNGLADLAKQLKSHCGVGGSVKDDVILLQGDQRERAIKFLRSLGYSQTKRGS